MICINKILFISLCLVISIPILSVIVIIWCEFLHHKLFGKKYKEKKNGKQNY